MTVQSVIKRAEPHWFDARAGAAHRMLEAIYAEFPPDDDSDAASVVFHAMEAIEAVDCALERRP